ncbi:MAG: xanthan lyase, partial [Bacteroidota bacterium]|nr:xanthan lyase [Bacteroidota bacterium]
MKSLKYVIILLALFLLPACSTKQVITEETKTAKQEVKETVKKQNSLFTFIDDVKNKKFINVFPSRTKIESYNIDSVKKELEINFSKDISYLPLREENVNNFYKVVKNSLIEDYKDYHIKLTSLGIKLEDLIPNFYRSNKNEYDKERLSKNPAKAYNVVYNMSRPNQITKGLLNRNIVLWQSHGWYYEPSEKRWVWQRPRLFQSVEDKVPLSFVVPYLLPMLENAGANVFDPRERDYQTNEAIVDNDAASKSYVETATGKNIFKTGKPGFALGNIPYYDNTNPFKQGSYRYANSDAQGSASFKWIPKIPEDGYYGVYISYNASSNNVKDADYTVNYSGGKTHFKVDQTIGGSTWIYLGR